MFSVVLGLIMLIGGGWLAWEHGVGAMLLRRDVANWTPVGAIVTESGVDQETRKSRHDGRTRYRDIHEFIVAYSYEYEGREYSSTRYNITPTSSNYEGAITELRERYPVGQQVIAYVNPDAPEQAVLVREQSRSDFYGFCRCCSVWRGWC